MVLPLREWDLRVDWDFVGSFGGDLNITSQITSLSGNFDSLLQEFTEIL